jgi:hypothetical protein
MKNRTYQQKQGTKIVLINKNKELMSMAFVLWTLCFTSSTKIRMRSRK